MTAAAVRATEPVYLANEKCTRCSGYGRRGIKRAQLEGNACGCIYRRVTECCLDQLHLSLAYPHFNHVVFSRRAEFVADMRIVARRTLAAAELLIWNRYFVGRELWFVVDRAAKLGRGQFFHSVYRIAERMGRALIDSPLFPTNAYFDGVRYEGMKKPARVDRNIRAIARKRTVEAQ